MVMLIYILIYHEINIQQYEMVCYFSNNRFQKLILYFILRCIHFTQEDRFQFTIMNYY
jgi:hypothetical protein